MDVHDRGITLQWLGCRVRLYSALQHLWPQALNWHYQRLVEISVKSTQILYSDIILTTEPCLFQGSHYILVLTFKDFQGPWSCSFKEQYSAEAYSMDIITAIFNIYFCDYGTVLVAKNKTW